MAKWLQMIHDAAVADDSHDDAILLIDEHNEWFNQLWH